MTIIFLFILGLAVGSFLNVAIDRIPRGKSLVFGRSYCDFCKHALVWYDLIPVVSFFLLGRKCRYCHKKISWQYPLVELLTGLLFVITYLLLGFNYQLSIINYQFLLIYHLLIISGLIAIFFTDLKYRIIPDQVLVLLTCATLVYLYFFHNNNLLNHFLTAIIFFTLFLILVLVTRGKGMGLGDVKYAAVSGFILGIPYSIVSFYLSFLTGALVSLILVIAGKKTMKSTIPFGPFLVGGTAVSLFYGDVLWNVFREIIGL